MEECFSRYGKREGFAVVRAGGSKSKKGGENTKRKVNVQVRLTSSD